MEALPKPCQSTGASATTGDSEGLYTLNYTFSRKATDRKMTENTG
jgi:hypothetical protein